MDVAGRPLVAGRLERTDHLMHCLALLRTEEVVATASARPKGSSRRS